jgi:uncharacterized protein YjiS (DUF1127 family)
MTTMTNLNVATLQEPEVARHRHVARAVARTAALILKPLVQAYRARRDTEYLMGLNDDLLKDIGIARCEVDAAVRWGQARR